MKTSVAKVVVTVSLMLGLGSSSLGCFVVTHDPALNRGVVTTTTRAELDGGARPIKRTLRPVEINDLSQDAR